MNVMTHDEAFAELESVALDTASVEVADAVRAHASTCPECGPELAALEQAVATLGTLVPAAEINRGRSAGIRSRIIMRARSERESRSAPVPGPPDLARGVASLRGQGHRVTPGAQRQVTGETKKSNRPSRAAPEIGCEERLAGGELVCDCCYTGARGDRCAADACHQRA